MARRGALLLLPLCLLVTWALAAAGAGAGAGVATEAPAAEAIDGGDDAGAAATLPPPPPQPKQPPPSPPPPPPVRTVHLVPHTHDDGGWLKTFDQYLYGGRQDIQLAAVGAVLDSALSQLRLPERRRREGRRGGGGRGAGGEGGGDRRNATKLPSSPSSQESRTFTYAEVGFFRAWWRSLPARQRRRARRLVALNSLEFAGGGSVQHDEACPHWRDMLDQTTRGHRWLSATFGPSSVPRVSWQLDPFGHSAAHAELFGSPPGGTHAFIYGRSDWRDRARRAARGELEHVWRPSASARGDASDALALAYLSGNYGPPPGLDWNWGTSPNDPIVDDPRSPDYNVPAFVRRFEEAANAYFSAAPRGSGHVLWMMGSDFTYAAAAHYYRNMDRLVRAVNAKGGGRYRAVYSTPGRYVAARAAEAAEAAEAEEGDAAAGPPPPAPPPLSVRRDDLFPYSDDAQSFWTGYFSSRPESKLLIRAAGARLQAARQLAVLSRLAAAAATATTTGGAPLPGGAERLEAAVALAQHHDAVTGTAKQAVVRDYHRRLYEGLADADALIGAALRRLLRAPRGGFAGRHAAAAAAAADAATAAASANAATPDAHPPPFPEPPEPAPPPHVPELRACPLLNVSHCPHTAGSAALSGFLVVAYNPLSRPRRAAPIRLPVRPAEADDGKGGDQGVGDQGGGGFAVWELVAGLGSGRRRAVASQLLPSSRATQRLQASTLGAVADGRRARRAELEAGFGTHDLAFVADVVPALGHRVFLVQRLAAGEAAPPGAVLSSQSSEQRFGVGGDPLPPGVWPEPVVVGNYDEARGGAQGNGTTGGGGGGGGDGIRLSFDYLSGRLSSVIGGGGFSPQGGRKKVSEGDGGGGGGGGWGPLPATMALASYLPHVGTHPPFASSSGGAPPSPACPVAAAGAADPRAAAAANAAAAAAVAAAATTKTNQTILAGSLQNSGAYIFRPDKSRPRALDAAADAGVAASQGGGGAGGGGNGNTNASSSPPPIPAAALRGPLLQEVRMDFADWASLAVRVWPLLKDDGGGEPSRGGRRQPGSTAGAASASAGAVVEVEWTVGPLPAWDDRGPGEEAVVVATAEAGESGGGGVANGKNSSSDDATASPPPPLAGPKPLGREAVFRLSTALLSRGVFFTDSNGREMQQRRRDARPWRWPADFYFEPQAANYYPVASAAALGDGELGAAVATDRAQGGASLEDGELELMVHRATPADDARGVGEPLRETAAGCRALPGRDPDGSVPSDACGRMVLGGRRRGGGGGGERAGGEQEEADNGDANDGDGDDDAQGPEAPADGGGGLIARGTFRVRFSPSSLLPRGSRLDQEELLSPLVLAFAPLPTPEAARALLAGNDESAAAAAAETPSGADEGDDGIGGGDVDSPVRVVTLMRSDGLHGARDAEEVCENEEEDADDDDDDDDDDDIGESGGGAGSAGPLVPAPPRCGAAAEAAAAADPRTFIVRLAHVFAAGEDPDKFSLPATFDLNVLFARAGAGLLSGRASSGGSGGGASGGGNGANPIVRLKRVTELSLTAAVPRADLPPRPRWRVADEEQGLGKEGEADKAKEKDEAGGAEDSWPGAYWRGPPGGGRLSPPPPPFPTYDPRDHGVGPDAEMAAQGIVELYPMEVRTFEVELEDEAAATAAATIARRAAPLPEAAAAAVF